MTASTLAARWAAAAPRLLAALRIVAAFIFTMAGTMKLIAFPAGVPPHGGTVPLWSEYWFAGVFETIGGPLLMLGLFTRPVAFVLAGEMAVAYFQFSFPVSVWPMLNNGVPAALFCFLWLYLSAAGPGAWSLDGRRARV
jgi:putative oxidoreductase